MGRKYASAVYGLVLVVGCWIVTSLAFAKTPAIPEVIEVTSKLPSADEVIAELWLSHNFDSPDLKRFHPKAKLIEVERQKLRDFIYSEGEFSELGEVPNDRKIIHIVRYRLSDPEIIELLIEAKQRGFGEVIIIGDLNTAMKGKFAPDEKFNSRFSQARFNREPMGKAIRSLKESDYKINRGPYGVYSQPLYNLEHKYILIPPSMHKKSGSSGYRVANLGFCV